MKWYWNNYGDDWGSLIFVWGQSRWDSQTDTKPSTESLQLDSAGRLGEKNWESTSQPLIFYTIYLPIINWEAGNNWDPRYSQLLFSIVRKSTVLGKKYDTEFLKNGKQKNSLLLKSLAKSRFKSSKKHLELNSRLLVSEDRRWPKSSLWTRGPFTYEIFQISEALFSLPQWLHVQLPSGKRLHNYGKSPCSIGKSTINHHFQ